MPLPNEDFNSGMSVEETKMFHEKLKASLSGLRRDDDNEEKAKQANKIQSSSAYSKMPSYIGTKVVCAVPMDEVTFLRKYKNDPDNDNETRAGYLVEYEDGYKSWSPKDVFERSYRRITDAERRII